MTPYVCQTIHNPPETYGDCIAACMRSMLDDPDVPHCFKGGNPEDSWIELRKYIKETHGKNLAFFVLEDPWEFMEKTNPEVYYMLICRTVSGDHAVVCRNGKVVHDPAAVQREITGPSWSAGRWVLGVLTE